MTKGGTVFVMQNDPLPVTSADDPRLADMGREGVAGADQIAALLVATPRDRLRLLLAGLKFEQRAHQARLVPAKPSNG